MKPQDAGDQLKGYLSAFIKSQRLLENILLIKTYVVSGLKLKSSHNMSNDAILASKGFLIVSKVNARHKLERASTSTLNT